MYTLPLTCNQLGIILLCVMFVGGFYMMYDTYPENIIIFSIGIFVAGIPTVIGIVYLIWYSGVFITKHVRCKCE